MSVLLNVGNEVTPGANLSANIKELCDNGEQEVRIPKQFSKMSVVTSVLFVLALNAGKFRADNQDRPDEREHPDDQIGLNDAQGLVTEVGFVGVLRLTSGDFGRR